MPFLYDYILQPKRLLIPFTLAQSFCSHTLPPSSFIVVFYCAEPQTSLSLFKGDLGVASSLSLFFLLFSFFFFFPSTTSLQQQQQQQQAHLITTFLTSLSPFYSHQLFHTHSLTLLLLRFQATTDPFFSLTHPIHHLSTNQQPTSQTTNNFPP